MNNERDIQSKYHEECSDQIMNILNKAEVRREKGRASMKKMINIGAERIYRSKEVCQGRAKWRSIVPAYHRLRTERREYYV